MTIRFKVHTRRDLFRTEISAFHTISLQRLLIGTSTIYFYCRI
jgi:hypothetical protein